MTLAIFDLDHTLLDGDSDYLWGEFMVENQIVDEEEYRSRNEKFYQDYQRGELDNDRYLEFCLQPLTLHSIDNLHRWRSDFVKTWIEPIIAPGSRALLDIHRSRGDTMMIISATNLFITAPIAELLDIPYILSTEPEVVDNRYTGRYLGTPTYMEGKVIALEAWLANSSHNLEGSYFYSDSINDLALLEQVSFPVAVNPDEKLSLIAKQRDWRVMDLRD
jgi:HAD superfamily hydrolase (TIGR01490 family)